MPGADLVPVAHVRDDRRVNTPAEPTEQAVPEDSAAIEPTVDAGGQPVSAAAPVPAPAPPRSRYSMGSSANMARSLLVILALVAGLIALVPRVDSVRQPPVDAASVVSYAVKESRTPFSFPARLPMGWTATSARYAASTDSLPTWQPGWTTPNGQFVGLRQTLDATPAWVSTGLSGAKVTGSAEMGGRTWEVRTDERNQLFAVSTTPDRLTTVVSATGGIEDIRFFVDKLTPAKPAS